MKLFNLGNFELIEYFICNRDDSDSDRLKFYKDPFVHKQTRPTTEFSSYSEDRNRHKSSAVIGRRHYAKNAKK